MRVAVIGAGSMGRRHIQAIENLGMTLIGIFDPLPESVSKAVDQFGLSSEQIFGSAEALLTHTELDGLVIASTAPSHCEYVCLAAQHGVSHILCEKPMAVSVPECDRMIRACREANAKLAINHPQRFLEKYTAVKALVDSDALGGLRGVIVSGANFGLAMNGSHYFEVLRYMSGGSTADTVTFWADDVVVQNPRGEQYKDRSGQLRVVMANGMRAYMELGGDLGHGIAAVYNCRQGQVFVDELAGTIRYVHRKQEHSGAPTTRYGLPGEIHELTVQAPDVVAAAQATWQAMVQDDSYPDGECGRNVVRALVAAQVSAERGRAVSVSEVVESEEKYPWA